MNDTVNNDNPFASVNDIRDKLCNTSKPFVWKFVPYQNFTSQCLNRISVVYLELECVAVQFDIHAQNWGTVACY